MWAGFAHKIPESARALCRMVSLTAAKTSRIFEVSVAWVRLDLVSRGTRRRDFLPALTVGIG